MLRTFLTSQGRQGPFFGFRILRSVDFAHGVVEGETQDLDKEVDGVAGEVSLGPAPVAFLDDETGIGGKFEVPRLLCDQLEFVFFQERHFHLTPITTLS